MLEWYRAGADYAQVMDDALDIVCLAAKTAGAAQLVHRGRSCDPFAPVQKITLAQAFTWFAGIDLMATLDEQGQGVRDALAVRARRGGITVSDDDDWSDIFSKILTARIEPVLGLERPVLLYAYPLCEAALARPCAHDPRLAERFELYACGVELANGFGELTDPVQQRARFEVEMAKKERVYGRRYPLDEDFLAALAHMPPASGVALGFDRLVMLATGAPHIDMVLWTPLECDPKAGERR
jgi:lysyl-tRNA synthetase class 2